MDKQDWGASPSGAEDPFTDFNLQTQELRARAGKMTSAQVEAQFREMCTRQGLGFDEAEIELLSRLINDEHWPIRHPIGALAWLWRHRESASWLRRLDQLRTRGVRFAG